MGFKVVFYAAVTYACLYVTAFMTDSMHGRDVYSSLSHEVQVFLDVLIMVTIVSVIIMAIINRNREYVSRRISSFVLFIFVCLLAIVLMAWVVSENLYGVPF